MWVRFFSIECTGACIPGVGWAARPDNVNRRGVRAAHAVIVGGKIIRHDNGAANDLA